MYSEICHGGKPAVFRSSEGGRGFKFKCVRHVRRLQPSKKCPQSFDISTYILRDGCRRKCLWWWRCLSRHRYMPNLDRRFH